VNPEPQDCNKPVDKMKDNLEVEKGTDSGAKVRDDVGEDVQGNTEQKNSELEKKEVDQNQEENVCSSTTPALN